MTRNVLIVSAYSRQEAERRLARAFRRRLSRWWPGWLLFAGEREMRIRIDGDEVRVAYVGTAERYGTPRGQTRSYFAGRIIGTASGTTLEGRICDPPSSVLPLAATLAVLTIALIAFTGNLLLAPIVIVVAPLGWLRLRLEASQRERGEKAQSEIRAIVDRLTGALEPEAGSPEDVVAGKRLAWG